MHCAIKYKLWAMKQRVKAETAKGDIFRGRIGPAQDKLMLEAARQLHQKLKLQPQIFKQIP